MSAFPPPYAPREHAQVQASSHGSALPGNPDAPLEFAESTSVCLEWRLTGLKQMYDSTKGDAKSKCIKSAVFGDADNLWEVLWYANSGVQGGEYASLYLSCVPTAQERDQSIGGKWKRTGVWFFRFEIKSLVPDERSNKIITLATKDAADHTFAVKTANWGWQQFAKRDGLFLHPTVQMADGFLILCTIQAQPQPPAGYWLGMGIPPSVPQPAMMNVGGRNVGSGGGLSAWSGGSGASGGVAGGVAAGGGIKRVVPRDLVSAVGSMLDDPLYSDIEFVFPRKRSRDDSGIRDDTRPAQRKIFANKKLLLRYDYFQAMFEGGFREVEGVMDLDSYEDDEVDMLSDSDAEDESDTSSAPATGLHLTTTTSRISDTGAPPRGPSPPASAPHSNDGDHDDGAHDGTQVINRSAPGAVGEGHADDAMEDDGEDTPPTKRSASGTAVTPPVRHTEGGPVTGPKKVKVAINDAAWSTWWALLYWIYTDTVYFAPLTSSFPIAPSRQQSHSRIGSTSSIPPASEAANRREWIQQWLDEHNIGNGETEDPIGPRPVSAKAMYRLADKLDLPSLKLRAFQHICSQLTVQNIPAEVFSRFSSTFEDVRKVQVAFFLKHWSEIKKSDTMTQIWQQIRTGKHVGFEEVWPLIVGQLEFKQS